MKSILHREMKHEETEEVDMIESWYYLNTQALNYIQASQSLELTALAVPSDEMASSRG